MNNLFYGSVTNDGVKIQYFRTGGKKPPVVLVHGLFDNGLSWGRVAFYLESEFDVVMIDARGHGLSNTPPSGYNMETYAADIHQVIRETGIDHPEVIGHSIGASAGVILARNNPDLISGLVLVDPPWLDLTEDEQRLRNMTLRDELKNQWNRYHGLTLQDLTLEGQKLHPGWDGDDVLLWAKARQQAKLQALDYLLDEPVTWKTILKEIKIPVLLLIGDVTAGGLVTPEVASEAVGYLQKGYTVHIPGAGHPIYRDQLQLFLDAVQMILYHHNWDARVKTRKESFWPFSRR